MNMKKNVFILSLFIVIGCNNNQQPIKTEVAKKIFKM